MENWKKFLNESDYSSTPAQLSTKDKKQAEEAIKQLIALQLGADAAAADADSELAERQGEIEETRRSRSRRKERIQRTKEIKKLAGLNGIKLTDFTPEQNELYKQTKLSLTRKEKEEQDVMASTVAHNLSKGDLLQNPIAKKILDKLPDIVKTGLLAAAGDDCLQSGAITLTCLVQGYGQNFGMLEEEDGSRLAEKKKKKDDRCTRIAKRKYDVWPSAYASGAVVRCRQGKIWKGEK